MIIWKMLLQLNRKSIARRRILQIIVATSKGHHVRFFGIKIADFIVAVLQFPHNVWMEGKDCKGVSAWQWCQKLCETVLRFTSCVKGYKNKITIHTPLQIQMIHPIDEIESIKIQWDWSVTSSIKILHSKALN